jgi:hypothetical protein
LGVADYVYIDEKRIDYFFAQISSPIKYDKVPVVGLELSLTGPKASGSQSRPSRPYTIHEKIVALLKDQKISPIKVDRTVSSDALFQNVSAAYPSGPTFVFLRMSATRVRISKSASSDPEFGGLALWVERNLFAGQGATNFYLIEDSPNEDKTDFQSGLTGLWTLLEELGVQSVLKESGAASTPQEQYSNIPGRLYRPMNFEMDLEPLLENFKARGQVTASAGIKMTSEGAIVVDGTRVYRVIEGETAAPEAFYLWRDPTLELSRRLFISPVAFLNSIGAKIGYNREIDALVLIRKFWIEITLELKNVFAVGYPLFIASSPSPFI